jgi:hypothetical protein
MTVLKKVGLIWSFYKSFIFLSLIVTACCVVLFWEYHFNIFPILFWLKVATLGITFVYINSFKTNEHYYYQNLGVSKTLLWSGSLIFDFSVFILLIFITSKF